MSGGALKISGRREFQAEITIMETEAWFTTIRKKGFRVSWMGV